MMRFLIFMVSGLSEMTFTINPLNWTDLLIQLNDVVKNSRGFKIIAISRLD